MKYSKIITAGILLLSFIYIDKIQDIIISKFDKFSSDRIVAELPHIATFKVNKVPEPPVVPPPGTVPVCHIKERTLEEEITGVLKNVGWFLIAS